MILLIGTTPVSIFFLLFFVRLWFRKNKKISSQIRREMKAHKEGMLAGMDLDLSL